MRLAVALLAAATAGCDLTTAGLVGRRYAGERRVLRASLAQAELDSGADADSLAWQRVADLYGRALAHMDLAAIERPATQQLERDLERLTRRALLGRALAHDRAGAFAAARRDYEEVLRRATPYRGARARAALGLAECEDHAGRWSTAWPAYQLWMRGVCDGTWSLQRQALAVPEYVSGRLRDRGARGDRETWIALAAAGLEAAAERSENAREARYARFLLFLQAARYDDAYSALRLCRDRHDPEHRDGGLLLAEASLLAGALGRQQEALGLLGGLRSETSPFDAEHRVAGWLLAAQIESRAGDLGAAEASYCRAAAEARSALGRSEATLGLARVHAQRGDVDLARRYYAQLGELYPGTPAGLLAPIEEVRLARQSGDAAAAQTLLEQAVRHYRAVMQQFGTELPAIMAAGYWSECLGLQGRWDRGVAVLDSIADAFGRDPRSGSLLVRAARLAADKLDDPRRARVLLRRLDTRYPNSDLTVAARGLADSIGER